MAGSAAAMSESVGMECIVAELVYDHAAAAQPEVFGSSWVAADCASDTLRDITQRPAVAALTEGKATELLRVCVCVSSRGVARWDVIDEETSLTELLGGGACRLRFVYRRKPGLSPAQLLAAVMLFAVLSVMLVRTTRHRQRRRVDAAVPDQAAAASAEVARTATPASTAAIPPPPPPTPAPKPASTLPPLPPPSKADAWLHWRNATAWRHWAQGRGCSELPASLAAAAPGSLPEPPSPGAGEPFPGLPTPQRACVPTSRTVDPTLGDLSVVTADGATTPPSPYCSALECFEMGSCGTSTKRLRAPFRNSTLPPDNGVVGDVRAVSAWELEVPPAATHTVTALVGAFGYRFSRRAEPEPPQGGCKEWLTEPTVLFPPMAQLRRNFGHWLHDFFLPLFAAADAAGALADGGKVRAVVGQRPSNSVRHRYFTELHGTLGHGWLTGTVLLGGGVSLLRGGECIKRLIVHCERPSYPGNLRAMRTVLAQRLPPRKQPLPPTGSAPVVTLLQRRLGGTRVISNVGDVAAALRGAGLCPEGLGANTVGAVGWVASEMRERMSRTDVLLALHGSDIGWAVFLPDGATVLEVVDRQTRQQASWLSYCAAAGLGYVRWELPTTTTTLTPQPAGSEGTWQCPMYLDSQTKLPLAGLKEAVRAALFAGTRPSRTSIGKHCPPLPPGYNNATLANVQLPLPLRPTVQVRLVRGRRVGGQPLPPRVPAVLTETHVARCRGPFEHWVDGRTVRHLGAPRPPVTGVGHCPAGPPPAETWRYPRPASGG
eukprot:TRINITY_DN16814_c0_g1_i5.p1 TRINITY_DN16814_c0_g1~~TRINITY_DN16814_c0_g1_i5.p1  ORF type:complete len:790 (+),score=159.45 TRINITY_DN16814_c0_g1_i5:54-2372(+)